MKRIIQIVLAAAVMTVVGCKEKKQSDDIITTRNEIVVPQASGPVRMQEYQQTKQVNWVGRTYTVDIRRMANDSLALVKDETGQSFVDNSISLRIVRADGSVFFSKTFTKQSFSDYLDEAYRQKGILEGLVFDKVDGNNLVFAASVSFPQTDEYIPLEVKVDNFGHVGIKRDENLDTYGNDDLDSE